MNVPSLPLPAPPVRVVGILSSTQSCHWDSDGASRDHINKRKRHGG